MARMVILYFEDNDDAEVFVKERDEAGYWPEGAMGGVSNDHEFLPVGELVGVYAMPTKWCEHNVHNRLPFRIVTGQKYQWRLHWRADCNLPVRGSQIAKNLIPREERPHVHFHSDVLSFHNYEEHTDYCPMPHVQGLMSDEIVRVLNR
jgi:hypothetical protein